MKNCAIEHTGKRTNVARDGLVGAAASMSATTFTHPLDVLKVRLALQGENKKAGTVALEHRWTLTKHIFLHEGRRSLYAGLSAALARQSVSSGLRFCVYGQVHQSLGTSANDSQKGALAKRLLAASAAGFVSALTVSPLDLALVRMQADRRLPIDQRRYRQSVFHTLAHIRATDRSLGALYRGIGPQVVRGTITASAQIGTYETTKAALLASGAWRDNFATQCVSGAGAGLMVALCSNPLDVVKVRMMNSSQKRETHTPVAYRNSWHCFCNTVRVEGARSLFAGSLASVARTIPHSVLLWQFVEHYRCFWDRCVAPPPNKK